MRLLCAVAVLLLVPPTGVPGKKAVAGQGASPDHTAWVLQVIKKTQTVKPGMTRADLLKVFTTEGGLSTPLAQRYVFRECRYVKVDVEFEPLGRPARDASGRVTSITSDADIVKAISKPFLEWAIMD